MLTKCLLLLLCFLFIISKPFSNSSYVWQITSVCRGTKLQISINWWLGQKIQTSLCWVKSCSRNSNKWSETRAARQWKFSSLEARLGQKLVFRGDLSHKTWNSRLSGFRCCVDHRMIHILKKKEDFWMNCFFVDTHFFSFPYLKRMTNFRLKKLKECEENAVLFLNFLDNPGNPTHPFPFFFLKYLY